MKNRSSMSCLTKVLLIFVVSLGVVLIGVESWTNPAHASNSSLKLFCFNFDWERLRACQASLNTCNANLATCTANLNTSNANLVACTANLNTCTGNLGTCTSDLAACEAEPHQIFPGDGYANPDAFGVSGHGPALSYTDNGDGTFTDGNTKLMWEEKTDVASSVHYVGNIYTWSSGVSGLFTVFLVKLNNTCQKDETIDCSTNGDADCTGVGGACGFAGHRDWRIPNVKELQSIVDYSAAFPASSVPGLTGTDGYWSATTRTSASGTAWIVDFGEGSVFNNAKSIGFFGRAVRP